MKKLFSCIFAVALLIWCYTLLFAALADVANKTWTVEDLGDRVKFTATFAFSATDSTNDLTSQAIDMHGLLAEGATAQFVADGETGRDVNIFVRGSNAGLALTSFTSFFTRTDWDDFSPDAGNANTLFDLSNTNQASQTIMGAQTDSAMVVVPEQTLWCEYFVFEVDGQASNPVTSGTNSTIIYLIFKKDPNFKFPGFEYSATTMVKSTT